MTFGAYVVDVVFPLSDVDFFEVGRGQGFECGVAQTPKEGMVLDLWV